jgi:site-specific DNA recombinase
MRGPDGYYTPVPAPWLAVYCRISNDSAGRAEGVGLQERLGREYWARARPGVPVEVYTDNDVSAAAEAKPRRDFDRLRADVEAGHVLGVWAVEQSRLTRREVEWFELAALFEACGIDQVHTNRDGVLSLDHELASLKAVLSAGEVRRLRRRIRDTMASRAAQGRPGGGRPWGYKVGRGPNGEPTLEIDDRQAEAIRFAADKVLAGWSMANIARALNEQGHRAARGGRLLPESIRSGLLSNAVAGFRTHHGQNLRPATWAPILDEATWRAVGARLTAPATVARADGGSYRVSRAKRPSRRYLLTSGIAVCGKCGAPLSAQLKKRRNGEPWPYYVCMPKNGGCSGVGITGEPLEAYVAEEVLRRIERPDYLAQLARDDHESRRAAIGTQLATVESRHVELATRWATGSLPAAAWDAAREALDAERARLTVELADVPPPVDLIDPGLIRAAWAEDMTLDEKQAVIRLHVAAVVVLPATTDSYGSAPKRTCIDWRAASA